MTTATITKATAEQARLVAEIWDFLALLGRPNSAEDIKTLVTEESGEYKSERDLRGINLLLKKQYRG